VAVEVLFLVLENSLLVSQLVLQVFDVLLLLLDVCFFFIKLLGLGFPLESICVELVLLAINFIDGPLRFLFVALPLGVNLFGPSYDLFLLSLEVIVGLALFPFLLEESDGLKRSCALDDVSSYFVKVFFLDLLVGILSDLLVHFGK
jgi:hypothetical protein